eukprot:5016951-Amphidinium_carterae.1
MEITSARAGVLIWQVGWMETIHNCCTCQTGEEHGVCNGHAQFVQLDCKQRWGYLACSLRAIPPRQ